MPKLFGNNQNTRQTNSTIGKRVFEYLTSVDIKNASQVNKEWHDIAKGWKNSSGESLLIYQLDLIPTLQQADKQRIAKGILDAFVINPENPLTIARLTGGYSPWAFVLKANINNQEYVIRVISTQKSLRDRKREMVIAKLYSALGVSPLVHYVDAEKGLIIMDYVEVVPRWTHSINDSMLVELANKLRTVHANIRLKRDTSVRKNGLLLKRQEDVNKILREFPTFYLHEQVLAELDKLDSFIEEKKLSHNDLNPNNVLYDGKNFWIIDLESAGLGDPVLDLAMLSSAARLSQQQEQLLLTTYYGEEYGERLKNKFNLMKIVAQLRLAISFFTNCQDHQKLVHDDISQIPAFSDYSTQDPKVDMFTDSGKYYISVMLAKEALRSIASTKYLDAIYSLSREQSKALFKQTPPFLGYGTAEARFIPDVIAKRIFSFYDKKTLQCGLFVNKQWMALSRATWHVRNHSEQNSINQLLSNDKGKKEIRDALAQTFVLSEKDKITLTPLNGGLSPWADVYFLAINERKYVIRVLAFDQDYGSRVREVMCMKIFSLLGLTPLVEYADLKRGIIIMQHIEYNCCWPGMVDKSVLLALARSLRMLHSVEAPSSNLFKTNSKFTAFYEVVKRVAENNTGFEYFKQVISAFDEIQSCKALQTNTAIGHYDANPWNLLHDGQQFWAIDWEFAQAGNGLFDLATITNFLRLSKENEQYLLQCYFGSRISTEQKAQYTVMKQLVYLRYAICSLGLCKQFDISLSEEELKSLPPFQQFKKKENPPEEIDKTTDIGRYKIAIMFAKQAFENMATEEYQQAVSVLNQDTHLPQPKFA